MHRIGLLLFVACGAPLVPGLDAGRGDAGRADAGLRACVPSSCDFAGTWQVTNTVIDPPTAQYCESFTQGPLQLTSDGDTVCMEGASQGTSDGGCEPTFSVVCSGFDWAGGELWTLQLADAGVLT